MCERNVVATNNCREALTPVKQFDVIWRRSFSVLRKIFANVQNPVTKRGGIRRTIKIWQGLVWHVNCFLSQRDGTKKAFGGKFHLIVLSYKMYTKYQRKNDSNKISCHIFYRQQNLQSQSLFIPPWTLALTVVILTRIMCSMVPVRGASSNWTTPEI